MTRARRIARDAFITLAADRRRAILVALAVAVSAGALSAVIAVGHRTRDRVTQRVRTAGLDIVTVYAGGEPGVSAPSVDRGLVSLFVEDARAIATLPNVDAMSAVQSQRGITVVNGNRSVVTQAVGVEPPWIEIRRWTLADGEFLSGADMWERSRVVVLGAKVARALFPDGSAVGSTVQIAGEPYTVKGVFLGLGANGADDRDDRVVVPLSTAMRQLFGRPYLEQIVIRVADHRRVAETAEQIRALLRERHDIPPGEPDDFFVDEPENIDDVPLDAPSSPREILSTRWRSRRQYSGPPKFIPSESPYVVASPLIRIGTDAIA